MVDQHPLELIRHNQRLLTRVYPSAYRQDSSNVEAVSFWNTGVQMGSQRAWLDPLDEISLSLRILVALNFQTDDVSMSLNYGRFADNHHCGYILKPAILRDSNARSRSTVDLVAFVLPRSYYIQSDQLLLCPSLGSTAPIETGAMRKRTSSADRLFFSLSHADHQCTASPTAKSTRQRTRVAIRQSENLRRSRW